MSGTSNRVSGHFYGPVVQAGHVGQIVLPSPAPLAVAGLPAAAPLHGRDAELAELASFLDPAAAGRPAVVSSGLVGVGKTALALRAAHEAVERGWFPGGVLFVDLQGYDAARRITPEAALGGFVRMLGVGEHVPPDPAPLYRSLLAQRERMLIVVDNAATSDQVRPLLPGTDPHRVLVTSRNQLADLGSLVNVEVLGEDAALELIGDRSDHARELARLCGHLPLALTIVAALLSVHPRPPISGVAADLADARHRLDELSFSGSIDVRAAFDLSYAMLTPDQQRAFGFLSIHPGPDIGLDAAMALVDLDDRRTRRVVDGLVRASLLQSNGERRHTFHDLVRLYAAERLDDAEDATARLIELYRSTVVAADRLIRPRGRGEVSTGRFTNRQEAMAWLDHECASVVACVSLATDRQDDVVACEMSHHMFGYLDLRRRSLDWIAINEAVLPSADRIGDRRVRMGVLSDLGVAYRVAGRLDDALRCYEEIMAVAEPGELGGYLSNLAYVHLEKNEFKVAIRHFRKSLALLRRTGDVEGEGQALNNLASCYISTERYDAAINCLLETLLIRRVAGDLHGEGQTLNNLGRALMEAGRPREAFEHLERGLAIKREVGDVYGEYTSLLNLGIAHRTQRDSVRARQCWDEAESVLLTLDAEEDLEHLRGLMDELDVL